MQNAKNAGLSVLSPLAHVTCMCARRGAQHAGTACWVGGVGDGGALGLAADHTYFTVRSCIGYRMRVDTTYDLSTSPARPDREPRPFLLLFIQGTGPESMCAWRSLRSDTLIADKPSLVALIKFVRCCGSARVS